MKRKIINQIKTSFPAKSINEGLARMVISALVCQLDPTVDELTDIKTAVSEAVTNSVVHGYGNGLGIIKMDAFYYDDYTVKVMIKDYGRGIEDVKKAMEPLYTSDKTGERSGMGFAIMESFSDKVKVTSSPGKGTTVTLEKKIGLHIDKNN